MLTRDYFGLLLPAKRVIGHFAGEKLKVQSTSGATHCDEHRQLGSVGESDLGQDR